MKNSKSRNINRIWIIHVCVLFLFIGSCGFFYILREDASNDSNQELRTTMVNVDTIPDAMVDDLAESRMDAFNQANEILNQERKERELQDEHNSFSFFMEEVEDQLSNSSQSMDAGDVANQEALDVMRENIGRKGVRQTDGGGRRRSHSLTEPVPTTPRSNETELSESEYYAQLEEVKQREKKEREKKLYEMYYGVRPDEEEETARTVEETPKEEVKQQVVKGGFKTLDKKTTVVSKNSIHAVVHNEQSNVTSSSQVKLRILDPILIDGFTIPKNTVIIGQASFHENRVMIHIENIAYNGNVYPFRGTIYDQDGFEGIYFPDNLINDVKKEASSETVSSADISYGGMKGLVGTGVRSVTDAAKSLFSGSLRETKVTLPANYKLIIKIND